MSYLNDVRLRIKLTHVLILCIGITFTVSLILAFSTITNECTCTVRETNKKNVFRNEKQEIDGHKLAVLVPYRNRFEELLDFAPYLHEFLNKQNIDHHIYILNQVDQYRFNRASLINIGFRFVKNTYDYVAMHDVDLLPLNENLSYAYPEKNPFHVASPDLHPKYHYPTFVGGILLINREQFAQVNGMSNKYWGWGLEDDEFYVRLRDAGLNVSRPINITTGTEGTFKHIHDRNHRKRDTAKCYNQREVTRKRDRQTGLNNVSYQINAVKNVTIDEAPVTILNIQLFCDRDVTPWCTCNDIDDKTKHSKKPTADAKTKKQKR